MIHYLPTPVFLVVFIQLNVFHFVLSLFSLIGLLSTVVNESGSSLEQRSGLFYCFLFIYL